MRIRRNIKKWVSLLLAGTMCVNMWIPVYAANEETESLLLESAMETTVLEEKTGENEGVSAEMPQDSDLSSIEDITLHSNNETLLQEGEDQQDPGGDGEEDSASDAKSANNLNSESEDVAEPEYRDPRGLYVPEEFLDETAVSEAGISPQAASGETEIFFLLEERVKNALLNGTASVDISDLSINRTGYDVGYLDCFSPYISNGITTTFYYNSNNKYTTIKLTNAMSPSATKTYFDSVDKKVAEIMAQVKGIQSPEQIALIIHDYLIYEYEYDYDNYLAGAIPQDSVRSGGLIMKGRGVCQAYAYAYKYFMNKNNIECYVTSSSSMNHAWNIIKINGSYYHVDCTWDDPVRDRLGQVGHANFLSSDTMIMSTKHSDWDLTKYSCNNTGYDAAYWKNVDSQIIINGSNAYYISGSSICFRNLSNNAVKNLKELGVWNVWGQTNSYWQGVYSGLFYQNGELYYNTATEIKKISLDGKNGETVYKPDTTNGYIYGSRKHEGELQYVIGADPNHRENMKKESIPLSTSTLVKPNAVTGLKAVSAGKKRVNLTWNKSVDADGYLVYAQKDGKYGYVGMTSGTSFNDLKALDRDYNYYWVFPYAGIINVNAVVGGTPKYVWAKGIAAAVTNLKASSVKGGIKLTWTASTGADGYLVYGQVNGNKYGYVGMTTKATTYTDLKASKSVWNFYWVFPYHIGDNGKMIVGGTPKYVYGKAQ